MTTTATARRLRRLHPPVRPRGGPTAGADAGAARRRAHDGVDRHRPPRHTTARDLATWLRPGDLLVVNTSATIPAALDATTAEARASSSTSRPSCRAGCTWSRSAGRSRRGHRPGPRRPHRRHARRRRRRHRDAARSHAGVGAVVGRHARPAGAVARAPLPLRPADPLPVRARVVAHRRLHELVRHRAGVGRDAVGRTGADAGGDHRPRRPRDRGRPDRAAHRRGVAGGARGAVPRALPGAGADGPAGQRHPRRRRAGRRHRDHRRPHAGDGVRRRRRSSIRARAGPSWSSRPSGACGSSTAC